MLGRFGNMGYIESLPNGSLWPEIIFLVYNFVMLPMHIFIVHKYCL